MIINFSLDIFGWRPLFYAVRSGNHELVKWLCEQGAGIQYSEQDVKLLLNLNLSASMRDLLTRKLKQNSYLSDASFSSLDDPLLLLLEGETNINRRAESTLRTPLHKVDFRYYHKLLLSTIGRSTWKCSGRRISTVSLCGCNHS